MLRVHVTSHRDIQSGDVIEAGESGLGEECRDEEGEFRGCVTGWVGQGEGVGGDFGAEDLFGGAELYPVSNSQVLCTTSSTLHPPPLHLAPSTLEEELTVKKATSSPVSHCTTAGEKETTSATAPPTCVWLNDMPPIVTFSDSHVVRFLVSMSYGGYHACASNVVSPLMVVRSSKKEAGRMEDARSARVAIRGAQA